MRQEYSIRQAAASDVPGLHALAETWLLENQEFPEKTGFLVSNFSIDEYHQSLEKTDYFWVAEDNEGLCGFLLAYPSDAIESDEIINSCLKYSLTEEFLLIKQICVVQGKKGVASQLYSELIRKNEHGLLLAAVVNEPMNRKSVDFHRRKGFDHLLDMRPPEDADGVIRMRSIWYRNASGQAPRFRFARPDKENQLTYVIEKQQGALSLYTHEDNLNWSKLGLLVSFMTALVTAFAILLNKDPDLTGRLVVPIVVVGGILINVIFLKKLKSGLVYMGWHKKNLQRFDAIVSNLDPCVPEFFDDTTRQRSETVRWMHVLPWFSLIVWLLCSATLVAKYYLL